MNPLLEAIRAEPDDYVSLHAYADWLTEHDANPSLVEFYRKRAILAQAGARPRMWATNIDRNMEFGLVTTTIRGFLPSFHHSHRKVDVLVMSSRDDLRVIDMVYRNCLVTEMEQVNMRYCRITTIEVGTINWYGPSTHDEIYLDLYHLMTEE